MDKYSKDFYSFQGKIEDCLTDIADFIKNNHTSENELVVIEQNSNIIHLKLYFKD